MASRHHRAQRVGGGERRPQHSSSSARAIGSEVASCSPAVIRRGRCARWHHEWDVHTARRRAFRHAFLAVQPRGSHPRPAKAGVRPDVRLSRPVVARALPACSRDAGSVVRPLAGGSAGEHSRALCQRRSRSPPRRAAGDLRARGAKAQQRLVGAEGRGGLKGRSCRRSASPVDLDIGRRIPTTADRTSWTSSATGAPAHRRSTTPSAASRRRASG